MPTEMQAEMTVRMHEGDAVSAMQEAVDQLALSMFDSLRLIPFAEEATLRGGGQGLEAGAAVVSNGAGIKSVKRAVAMNAAWQSRVQLLAEGVLKKARALDALIDTLPGADMREDQQMEELARLDEEGRRKRTELAQIVSKADELSTQVNGSLDKLADHMLAAPR